MWHSNKGVRWAGPQMKLFGALKTNVIYANTKIFPIKI